MKYWYKKPKDMKWTDLCKYFDKHIYDDNKSEEEVDTLFKYMFCIYHMLASKKKYFDEEDLYNSFAMYCAGETYRRIVENKIGTKHGGKPEKLRNLLDYAKASLPTFRIRFLSDEFNFTTDPNKIDLEQMEINYREMIRSNSRLNIVDDVISELDNVDTIIIDVISKTPYKNDKLMCKRLYTSCMLSFLSSLTLSKDSVLKLYKNKNRTYSYKCELIQTMFEKEKINSVVCWCLPDTMKDYIFLLTNKVREILTKNINKITYNAEITDDVLDDIIMSISTEAYEGNDDEINNNINLTEVRGL